MLERTKQNAKLIFIIFVSLQTLSITVDKISRYECHPPYQMIMDSGLDRITLLKGIVGMTYIDFSNNTLNCNCDLLNSLYDVSQYFTKRGTPLDLGKCKIPKRFEGVKMIELNWTMEYEKCKQLPPDENQKFHQGCPTECRCVYHPFTKSSVINCQNTHLQDYPRTLPVAPDADHTELTLYGNELQEFSFPDDPGYKNVTFLNLAKNVLSTFDINGVSMKLKV